MKICSACKTNKDESEFNKRSSASDGLQRRCRACQADTHQVYYQSNTEVWTQRRRLRRKGNQQWLEEQKSKPCMDCGNTFKSCVMEFDHRDPSDKIRDISQMVMNNSREAVLQEILKCDLVCANCHRLRTCERSHQYHAPLV